MPPATGGPDPRHGELDRLRPRPFQPGPRTRARPFGRRRLLDHRVPPPDRTCGARVGGPQRAIPGAGARARVHRLRAAHRAALPSPGCFRAPPSPLARGDAAGIRLPPRAIEPTARRATPGGPPADVGLSLLLPLHPLPSPRASPLLPPV